MKPLYIIIAIAVVIGLYSFYVERKNIDLLLRRKCAGKEWKSAFPHASKESIREFLEIFTQEFILPKSKKLSFTPNDRVIDIYNARYKGTVHIDMMECESLCLSLSKRYESDFAAIWHENITLGELYLRTTHQQPNQSLE